LLIKHAHATLILPAKGTFNQLTSHTNLPNVKSSTLHQHLLLRSSFTLDLSREFFLNFFSGLSHDLDADSVFISYILFMAKKFDIKIPITDEVRHLFEEEISSDGN